MELTHFHHVAIICSDYERPKDFYVRQLGLKIAHEEYREERDSYKLDLALADGSRIELFSFPETPPRPSRPEACGLRHLAFATENIKKAVTELKELNIPVEPVRTDHITGQRFTFFFDPDNLPLELYETKSLRTPEQ